MEVLKPIALCRGSSREHRTQVRMDTTHMSIAFFFFLIMILTLGELRRFFLPDIAAVEAGGRAVVQSC